MLGPLGGETVTVPDFSGLTLADAGRLSAELGLLLKQGGGAGFVVEQSPAPGDRGAVRQRDHRQALHGPPLSPEIRS